MSYNYIFLKILFEDISLQKKYVNSAIDYINAQEKIIVSKYEKDKKLYRSVSLTVGLFIVIILV